MNLYNSKLILLKLIDIGSSVTKKLGEIFKKAYFKCKFPEREGVGCFEVISAKTIFSILCYVDFHFGLNINQSSIFSKKYFAKMEKVPSSIVSLIFCISLS